MYMSMNELQEMVMDKEAWRAVIHGVEKSQTRLSDWTELKAFSKRVQVWWTTDPYLEGLELKGIHGPQGEVKSVGYPVAATVRIYSLHEVGREGAANELR